jgi:uncharacterized protein (TIGR00296 family)/AmmeMemoRadiSam system protein B
MSLSSVDSEAYYTDSSSTTSTTSSFYDETLINNNNDNNDNDDKDNNIFLTPYDEYTNSWFQTEDKLSISSYIKRLFSIVRGNLSCNVEANTTKAILVPHAGIKYSGLCAASAYYEFTNRTRPIKNVILLCTSHNNLTGSTGALNIMAPRFNKINTSKKGKFLSIDKPFINKIKHLIQMDNPEGTYFQQEHAFFNQIPFLEVVAPNASICPLLIGNLLNNSNNSNDGELDTIKLKHALFKLQIFINLLKDKLAKNDTVLICSSDFSHINGHFDTKVASNIFQNIRKLDNETLQFLYNIVDGNESRNQIIDTVLFMQNSASCGIMAIYLFGKILNAMQSAFRPGNSSSSSDSGSELSLKSFGKGKHNGKGNIDKAYYSRISCYYSSITREFMNISDPDGFDKKTLTPLYEIRGTNKSSVSYIGLIYTNQAYIQSKQTRKIANMLTQYEELALLALAREQLFYHLIKADRNISMPTNLIRPINAQVFALDLGVFTTLLNKKRELRGCIGTLETGNNEFNIESNVKKYIIEAATHDSRFEPVDLSEFHKLDISITVLYELAPITLNQYFTNKFQLGRDGILMKLGQKQGYFLPAVATDLGLRAGDKNKLLDELCREKVAGCDTKTAYRKYSNTQLFYNEGLEFHF